VDIEGRVLDSLSRETRFGDIRLLDRTGSTNDVVAEAAAAGAPEGLVVVADFQTAGRGRLDRTWEAQPGDGLLVSVLLRPTGLGPDQRGLVPSAVALAGRAACSEVAGVSPEIKWPNDLLGPNGAKLAGILAVEVAHPAGRPSGRAAGAAVVVGMGLNVHGAPPGAVHLDGWAGRRVGRAPLLEQWLRLLDGLVDDWPTVADRYRQECATIGRRVSVQLSGGEVAVGTARRLDDQGRLVVEADDGSERTLAVGDVTHLRW